jgi:putative transposase
MPRHARLDAEGVLHHIIIRGIEKRLIFRDDIDKDRFVERMGKVFTDTHTPCYAWALLGTHAHLLLKTGTVPLHKVMARLLTGHAVTFNKNITVTANSFRIGMTPPGVGYAVERGEKIAREKGWGL